MTVNGGGCNVNVGDQTFANLEAAFAYQVETGAECVSLCENTTVEALKLPVSGVLDLNGYTLTADTVDSIAAGAKIIDTTDGEGLLIVNGKYEFSPSNPQLPAKDETAGGFRFFTVTVRPVAVTGETANSPKIWFQVEFDNFQKIYELIRNDADFDIMLLMHWDDKDIEASAGREFLEKWAEAYKANDSLYITVKLDHTEGKPVSAIPAIGANGVTVTGNIL